MKTALKPLFTIVLLASVLFTASAQRTGGGFDWDRVVWGGGIFPSFSNLGTSFSANPFIGYKVTDKLVPGVMLQYQYTKLNSNATGGFPATYQLVGVSPFVRYTVYGSFFAQAEYEFLNGSLEQKPFPKASFSENNFLIGGGYISQFSDRSGVYAQVMYMPTWRGATSVYSSPWVFRIGFTIF